MTALPQTQPRYFWNEENKQYQELVQEKQGWVLTGRLLDLPMILTSPDVIEA